MYRFVPNFFWVCFTRCVLERDYTSFVQKRRFIRASNHCRAVIVFSLAPQLYRHPKLSVGGSKEINMFISLGYGATGDRTGILHMTTDVVLLWRDLLRRVT